MCGIVGIFDLNNNLIKKSEIQPMVDSIAHRGPDGEGIICHGPVGLGHKRLSIFDLSEAGSQPMTSQIIGFL